MTRTTSDTESRLARAAIVVTALCALTVLGTVGALAMSARRAATLVAEPRGPAVGSRAKLPADWLGPEAATVVVYFRSDCAVCQRSVGEIAQLVRRAQERGAGVRFVSDLGREAADREFIARLGHASPALLHRDLAADGIRDVPTFAVVSAAGTVEFAAVGAPQPESAAVLLDHVSRLTTQQAQ